MISTLLAAVANNFGVLWPLYWSMYGFEGDAPAVPFYYGPKSLTQQNAPNQIVVVLGREPMVGPEVHSGQPNAAPRELRRMWTRFNFYCWGQQSVLDPWQPSTDYDLLDDALPTAANQNGCWFQATVGGESGATEPTWPTGLGDTVVDGGVTWTNMGLVDAFRIYDTDVPDLMRTVMVATMHYTAVGAYKAIEGAWYDATDQLVMSGTINRVAFDVFIPLPDLAPSMGIINLINLQGQLVQVVPS